MKPAETIGGLSKRIFNNHGRNKMILKASNRNKKGYRILLDTNVCISYFGDRPPDQQKRILLAQEIINYCLQNQIELFYCAYVEAELNLGQFNNPKRIENIIKLREIANSVPSHIGSDTWDKISVPWDQWGGIWNNTNERNEANDIEIQLPDKKNKSNRIDRNIVLTAKQENIDIILHENPADFDKLAVKNIKIVDLLKIRNVDAFIQKINESI